MSSLSFARKLGTDLLNKNARFAATRCTSFTAIQVRTFSQFVNIEAASAISNVHLNPTTQNFRRIFLKSRSFSDKTVTNEGKKDAEEATEGEESAQEEVETSETEKLEEQVKEMKDQLLRSLAEQENIRRIAKRDVENARNFAVTSFAKSLLDTSDNLSRAMDAVPEDLRKDTNNHPVLATLYEGIQMTDDGLTKAFTKNGLKKFGAPGDKFDPNMHEALFEYPDENMDAGSVGQVMKVGFTLNDRVIRPAEVGVTKDP